MQARRYVIKQETAEIPENLGGEKGVFISVLNYKWVKD